MSWLITPQTKVPVDPVFSNVSLLLHGNGTNGSTTITDSSLSPKTVTAFGNAQISTAQSKFGGASLYLDGTGSRLSVNSNSADLALGFGSFTIEGWIRTVAYATAAYETYWPIVARAGAYHTGSSSFLQAYVFRYSPQEGNRLVLNHRPSSVGFVEGTHMFTKRSSVLNLSHGTWYYVATVRDENDLRIYLDGVNVTDTLTGNYNWSSFDFSLSVPYFEVGRMRGGPDVVFWNANGYIDELRITKGVARYTSNFTPPAAPFPDI